MQACVFPPVMNYMHGHKTAQKPMVQLYQGRVLEALIGGLEARKSGYMVKCCLPASIELRDVPRHGLDREIPGNAFLQCARAIHIDLRVFKEARHLPYQSWHIVSRDEFYLRTLDDFGDATDSGSDQRELRRRGLQNDIGERLCP